MGLALAGYSQLSNARAQARPIPQSVSEISSDAVFTSSPRSRIGDLAQAQPPQNQTQTQIGDLKRTDGIAISGRVESIVGNDFILEDGTGQIIVDAGPRWWQEINLTQGEEVTVTGKLSDRSREFDAFSIRRANGQVIDIRSGDGPPPWAGNPNRNNRPGRR